MFIFPRYGSLKGLLVVLSVVNIIFDNADASQFQGNLPDLSLISTLFNMFIKPYIRTWRLQPTLRAFEEAERTVERVVREKVKQLQPYLQDNDVVDEESDNEITFDGNDETTIIEFVPQTGNGPKTDLRNGNDTFKDNMRKYKRVRNKIYEALDAELVSDKTKSLIIRTLDELLSKMVETQCHWKGGLESTADNIQNRFIIPRTIVSMWRDEWKKFKSKVSTLAHLRAKNKDNNVDMLISHLIRLNNIINDVSVNMESFAKMYRIRCKVSEKKDLEKNKTSDHQSFRLSYDSDNENKCKNFKVCSQELKSFLIDLYNSVNDTTINVLRSYAEMFTRDVNTDVSNEKNSIIDFIFKIAEQTEKNITKVFVNYTTNFQLDRYKEKEANLKLFSHYVKNVIKEVNDEVIKNLLLTLNYLNKKISSNIQQDIQMNLGVDLGNLERDMIDKICLIFNICNGDLKNRRHAEKDAETENSIGNENKIFVKVELTIDDDDNDILKTNIDTHKNVPELNTKKTTDGFVKSHHFREATLLNYRKYANISVTRTTLISQGS